MASIEGRHYLERERVESQMKQSVQVLNEIQSCVSSQPMMMSQMQALQAMLTSGRQLLHTTTDLSRCVCVCVCVCVCAIGLCTVPSYKYSAVIGILTLYFLAPFFETYFLLHQDSSHMVKCFM